MFDEVDRLMRLLFAYDESHFHAADAEPPYMVPTTRWVRKNGFYEVFPGGSGLVHESERFPTHGVLILGHNYDSEQSYLKAVARGYAGSKNATFARLFRLMQKATHGDFDPMQCFLSNRMMGVRRVRLNSDGVEPKNAAVGSSGRRYRPYQDLCARILDETMSLMRPAVIVTLGRYASKAMGIGKRPWAERGLYKILVGGHATKLVCLTHTGGGQQYLRNVKAVRYGDFLGIDAELALMRDAWNAFRDAEKPRLADLTS